MSVSINAEPKSPLPPSPTPLYCDWLWNTVTVLCDGTVTCGLDDPFKLRNHGSLKSASLREIFAAAPIAKRREELLSGKRCFKCTMYTGAEGRDLKPSSPYPRRMVLEATIKCNIRCTNETCNIANDAAFHLRREDFMQLAAVHQAHGRSWAASASTALLQLRRALRASKALDMLAYAKKVNPNIRVTTSTNGILLAREGLAERIVEEGLVDWICFTIGGVDQETYGRYHKAGSFEKAMTGMRRMVEAKKRFGKTKPTVHWRYLVFNWNDTDECVAEALRLRDEIGMDEFKFMLTASPIEGRSLSRAPGTPGFDAIKPWLAYQDFYSADPLLEAVFGRSRTVPGSVSLPGRDALRA